MQAEDALLDNCCQGQVVEERCEVLPHIGIAVFPEALIIEAVNLSDLLALVISSQDCDPPWEANLEDDEESDGLDGVVAAVHVVTHE